MLMADAVRYLRFRKRSARPTRLTDDHNLQTIQSALLRGDREVTLEACDAPSQKLLRQLRYPHDSQRPHYASFKESYRREWKPRWRRLSRPAVVKRLLASGSTKIFDGFELHWIKVLGKGGYGIATLWEAVFEDASTMKVVIKFGLADDFEADLERGWHLRYEGASHIVQAVDLAQMAADRRDAVQQQAGGAGRSISGREFDASELNVLPLEYAERGSLTDLLGRKAALGFSFSDKVLWGLWENLVRGVASSAYQPSLLLHSGPSIDEVLREADKGDHDSWIDMLSRYQDSHDLHLDLEESNILVSSSPDYPHGPILKLNDFGPFSCEMMTAWSEWEYDDYLYARMPPKMNRPLPEQVAKEWESFETANPPDVSLFQGANLARGCEVAGRFGTWSNIFLIGSIMHSIITESWVSHPFRPRLYETVARDKAARTYGWRLTRPEYKSIDPELLDLVLQCQFEKPGDRPRILRLLQKCFERKKRGFSETDDDTAAFWEMFWTPTREEAEMEMREEDQDSERSRSPTVRRAGRGAKEPPKHVPGYGKGKGGKGAARAPAPSVGAGQDADWEDDYDDAQWKLIDPAEAYPEAVRRGWASAMRQETQSSEGNGDDGDLQDRSQQRSHQPLTTGFRAINAGIAPAAALAARAPQPDPSPEPDPMLDVDLGDEPLRLSFVAEASSEPDLVAFVVE